MTRRRMFEKFTEKGIKVIMLAQEEARRLGHNFVGTEQMLLGIIGEETSEAAKVLAALNINLRNARIEVETLTGRGSGPVPVEIPFTPRAKRTLELAFEAAKKLDNNYINPNHLLLALVLEGEGLASKVIKNLGANLEDIQSLLYSQDKQFSSQEQSDRVQVKIFLAHASEDKPQVSKIYASLKEQGYQPWLDKIDLMPGQNWRSEIPKAIRNSDVFLACLSSRSVSKRSYIQKEFRLALNQYAELPPDSIYLIPLRLDECAIPDLRQEEYGVNLRDIHWLDYWEEDGFETLIKVIEHVRQSKLG